MPYRFTRASGLILMLAGLSFWLGWALMPDAGTNDPAHILRLVAAHRQGVWWSVVTHLLSSLAFVIAVVGLQTERRCARSKTTRVGATLVLMGAMGVCMDAFFHLVAYYMTAASVAPAGVLEPMRLLQTQGILFLVPLLLALIVGGTVYSAGFYHIDATSPWSKRVFLAGLAWALIGGLIAARTGMGRQLVSQGLITFIALAYCWLGYEVLLRWRPER
ncbi:MAG TPA: hypothetical protein V6D23_05100 [Candidatus Obscuribacterales bacterium]